MMLFLITVSAFAQDKPTPPPISSENFSRLQSVMQINFEDGLEAVVPESESHSLLSLDLISAWFALDPSGYQIAIPDAQGEIYVLYGQIINFQEQIPYQAAAADTIVIDIAMNNHIMAAIYTDSENSYLSIGTMTYYGGDYQSLILPGGYQPVALWINCGDSEEIYDCEIFLELLSLSDGKSYIWHISSDDRVNNFTSVQDLEKFPYTPAQDPEAIVRIGRIHPPYTVTSSIDGIVKLWNLETGEILYEVDNSTGEAAVFGNINADATHLVWRDHGSNALYLLNFETGENRFIDYLNGGYVQWFFLSNDAGVIIAVNYNFEPSILAWNVETGERTVLGEYRQCNRPQPDMARLSADGTTLLIGCDTGLDIWRIVEE
jgi:WD40 repeat protein